MGSGGGGSGWWGGYKKVLYNIKKIKKCGRGEGEGQYLNQKHYVFKKEK